MLRFFKEQKIDVFFGSSSSIDSTGGFIIEGNGNVAEIILIDKNKSRKKLTIMVNTLHQLKKDHYFQTAEEDINVETLLNTWITKRSERCIIKYATDKQLAFVLYNDHETVSEADLDDVCKHSRHFSQIDYFKERYFLHILATQCGVSLSDLQKLPPMRSDYIPILANQAFALADILTFVSLQQLFSLEYHRLMLLLNNANKIHGLFKIGLTYLHFSKIDMDNLVDLVKAYTYELEKALSVLTIDQLTSLKRPQLDYMLRHADNMKILFAHGLTFEQFIQINTKTLKKIADITSYKLENIVKLITIQQLLGVDHTPLVINDVPPLKRSVDTLFGLISGAGNGFSWHNRHTSDKKGKLTLTYKDQSSITVTWIPTDEERIDVSKIQGTAMVPKKMIFDWYLLKESTYQHHTQKMLYSPELAIIVIEERDHAFPYDIAKNNSYVWSHVIAPYYDELNFVDFITANGCSIAEIEQLAGMTKEKMLILFYHQTVLKKLMDHGITFSDIAVADVKRLAHVVNHFLLADDALQFVSAHELLAVPHIETDKMEEEPPKSCRIM